MATRLAWHASPAVKRRNWTKRTAFVVLAVLGAAFWISPLLRATVGDAEEAAALPDDSVRETPATADVDFWSEKPSDVAKSDALAARSPRSTTQAVIVTATILGKSRRAAVVNGRVRREGDRFVVADELFRLVSVAKDRVELLRDGPKSGGDRSLTIRTTSEHNGTK